ncbi:hypothetical protein FOMPIDRAFT_1059212 [Fomitopsis schrenkii]|uniref:Uncharacterized protein n=1 Tax=Fomitopsis schrenkii TaxID=2126942 RepID=S8ECQ7_FOMSC|nr:hypothetical protein FOMPIDRAFT_1059212 [Fomitopsis schrenkii]
MVGALEVQPHNSNMQADLNNVGRSPSPPAYVEYRTPSPLPLYGLRHHDRLVMAGSPLPSVRPRQSTSARQHSPTHNVVSTPQTHGDEIRLPSTQIAGRERAPLQRQASSGTVRARHLPPSRSPRASTSPHTHNVLTARSSVLDSLHCERLISAIRASIASGRQRHAADGISILQRVARLLDALQLSDIATNQQPGRASTNAFVRILEVKLTRAYDDTHAPHDTTVRQFLFRRIPTWEELVEHIASFYCTTSAGLFLSYSQSSTTLPSYSASDTLAQARGPLGLADMLTRAYPDSHIEFAANAARPGTSHAILGYGTIRLRTIRSSRPRADIPARPIIKQIVRSEDAEMEVKEPEASILRHVRELRKSIAQSGMRRVSMNNAVPHAPSSGEASHPPFVPGNPVQAVAVNTEARNQPAARRPEPPTARVLLWPHEVPDGTSPEEARTAALRQHHLRSFARSMAPSPEPRARRNRTTTAIHNAANLYGASTSTTIPSNATASSSREHDRPPTPHWDRRGVHGAVLRDPMRTRRTAVRRSASPAVSVSPSTKRRRLDRAKHVRIQTTVNINEPGPSTSV